MKTTLLKITAITLLLIGGNFVQAQCVLNPTGIYTFTYNGATYEVVRESKTWTEAAACAVIRGGYLTEITDQAEQDAIYSELGTNAGITVGNTIAPDGGGASYVWIGGNDIGNEGQWIWDGANTSSGPQFWQGTSTGSAVSGLYNNWGNEPDDFNGQDALGLAITNWPLGVSSQWNDIDDGNFLYFVIEFPNTSGLIENSEDNNILVSPNPIENQLTIKSSSENLINHVTITTVNGQIVRDLEIIETLSTSINVEALPSGIYYANITLNNGDIVLEKIVK